MANPFQDLAVKMKEQLPGAIATGLFSIGDGLMLALDSDVPDTDQEALSASHAVIWDKINAFLNLLPSEIVGEMRSMVLEVKGANFYVSVDKGFQIAAMAASDNNNGNLGLLRVVTKRYLNKALYTLSNL